MESGDWHDVEVDLQYPSRERPTAPKCIHCLDNRTRATNQTWLRNIRGGGRRFQIAQTVMRYLLPQRVQIGRDLIRLREQVWRECRSVAHTLRDLYTTVRDCLAGWYGAVAQRISRCRRFVFTQQELWRVWFPQQRARLRLFLSEQLTAAQGSQQNQGVGRWTRLRLALAVLRMAWTGCCTRIAVGFQGLFTQCWHMVNGVGGYGVYFPCPVLLPAGGHLSGQQQGQFARSYVHSAASKSGGAPLQDLAFLWTEPQGRGLVVALAFAFATLSEVVAASSLPAWCASLTHDALNTADCDVMAAATFSHSVVMTLKGAALSPCL